MKILMKKFNHGRVRVAALMFSMLVALIYSLHVGQNHRGNELVAAPSSSVPSASGSWSAASTTIIFNQLGGKIYGVYTVNAPQILLTVQWVKKDGTTLPTTDDVVIWDPSQLNSLISFSDYGLEALIAINWSQDNWLTSSSYNLTVKTVKPALSATASATGSGQAFIPAGATYNRCMEEDVPDSFYDQQRWGIGDDNSITTLRQMRNKVVDGEETADNGDCSWKVISQTYPTDLGGGELQTYNNVNQQTGQAEIASDGGTPVDGGAYLTYNSPDATPTSTGTP